MANELKEYILDWDVQHTWGVSQIHVVAIGQTIGKAIESALNSLIQYKLSELTLRHVREVVKAKLVYPTT